MADYNGKIVTIKRTDKEGYLVEVREGFANGYVKRDEWVSYRKFADAEREILRHGTIPEMVGLSEEQGSRIRSKIRRLNGGFDVV